MELNIEFQESNSDIGFQLTETQEKIDLQFQDFLFISGETEKKEDHSLFQRVEYIVSDEASYIDTDFIADDKSGIELVAAFPLRIDRVPIGSRFDSGMTRFYVTYPALDKYVYCCWNGSWKVQLASSIELNKKYTWRTNLFNKRQWQILNEDGSTKLLKPFSGVDTTELSKQHCPVRLFAISRGDGVGGTPRAFTFYSARLTQGSEVVREYIPCYRKSDGEIGVWERYTEQFLPNQGTGAFTKGPDVEWNI